MAEGKKYIILASEMYEMLLIKAETPENLKSENLNTVWNRVGVSEEEKV